MRNALELLLALVLYLPMFILIVICYIVLAISFLGYYFVTALQNIIEYLKGVLYGLCTK